MSARNEHNVSILQVEPDSGEDLYVMKYDELITLAATPFLNTILGAGDDLTDQITLLAEPNVESNYTSVCLDPGALFHSTSSFFNCLVLALTAVLVQNHTLLIDSSSVQSADEALHFGNLTAFNGTSVFGNIADCVMSSCQNSSFGSCPSDVKNLAYINSPEFDPHNPSNLSAYLSVLYWGLSIYCDDAGSGSNPDIAGPGVIISYIIQCCIVFLTFFVYKLGRVIYLTKTHILKRLPKTQTGSPSREKVSLFAPIKSTMVEFQETQCIFVATIQIAALAFFNPTTLADKANTYGEAVSNTDVINRLAFDGMFPVLIGQVVLQRAGKHWWYTTALTTLVFVLGMVCEAKAGKLSYATLWAHFAQNDSIEQCGFNPSPYTYCFARFSSGDNLSWLYTNTDGFLASSPVSNIRFWAIAYLLIDQFFTWSRGRFFVQRAAKLRKVRFAGNIIFVWRVLWWISWFLLQCALLIGLVGYIVMLATIFVTYSGGLEEWSFGQLVAVMVWVPLTTKFLYYTFFGVEKGVENRIDGRLEIRLKDDDGHPGLQPSLSQQQGDYRQVNVQETHGYES
ncbi:hypothetical protein GGR54DRAFT_487701 [Hypoxylon sp. NC1633]|nr:hypothetical protein GGR54DRAFT_487701 [Hypoxylon sp. NC1633]